MKHGPIALISDGFPVVALAPRDSSYERMLGNIEEVRAREGQVIAVVQPGDKLGGQQGPARDRGAARPPSCWRR